MFPNPRKLARTISPRMYPRRAMRPNLLAWDPRQDGIPVTCDGQFGMFSTGERFWILELNLVQRT